MFDFTESPFPLEVLNLHYRLQNAETPEEQAVLIVELAELLFLSRDHFDLSLTERDHRRFEEYEQARLALAQAAERLVRRVGRVIDMYMEENELTWNEVSVSDPPAN
jgi:hypothetical protein